MNSSVAHRKSLEPANKIGSKIISSCVVNNSASEPAIVKEIMTEEYARPDMLLGSSYKIKPAVSEHAMYITVNDTILNAGTIHEERRPFEIFINSKNMKDFQWVVALTRLISAVFRKGGDVTFLVDELLQVFDPQGGYFLPGGKFMPSVVAQIGLTIKNHLTTIGLLKEEELDEHQKKLIETKKAEFKIKTESENLLNDYPVNATVCAKCQTKAVIKMDGCDTCLSCGSSKCG